MSVTIDKEKMARFACKCDEGAAIAFASKLAPVADKLAGGSILECSESELGTCNVASFQYIAGVAVALLDDVTAEQLDEREQAFATLIADAYATIQQRFPAPQPDAEPDAIVVEGAVDPVDDVGVLGVVNPQPEESDKPAE